MRYTVQYCVLYSFCRNVRPVLPRIRTSVLTVSLRQNADGAVLSRAPARAHSQAERHCLALSPPRGQGSGRQKYATEKRPHTVEYDYGEIDRTGVGIMTACAPRVLAYFCFLTARRLLCARATKGAAPAKRYPAARHKRINTGHDTDARLCRLAHYTEHQCNADNIPRSQPHVIDRLTVASRFALQLLLPLSRTFKALCSQKPFLRFPFAP